MKWIVLASVVSVVFGAQCESPKYQEAGFSTTDGFFHYHTTFIVDFALQCSNNVRDLSLFSVVNGKVNQVALSEETGRYQTSWSLPNEESASQTFDVKIYDEEQIEQYFKAVDRGDGSSVKPSFVISYYHPGVSKNWPLTSETVALIISILGVYGAISFRSELKA